MMRKLVRSIWLAAVGTLFGMLVIYSPALAQDTGDPQGAEVVVKQDQHRASTNKALAGVWNAMITLRVCATGAAIRTFPAIYAFERGGTMHETSVGNAPNPRSSAYGIWSHLSDQSYFAAYQFFFFNVDGTFAGRTRIRKYYTVDFLGENLTAQGTFEAANPSGVVINAGCITETATRFVG